MVTMVALRTIVDIKRASHVARFYRSRRVAALRRFIESCAVSVAADGDQLGEDAHRDLLPATAPISNPIGA